MGLWGCWLCPLLVSLSFCVLFTVSFNLSLPVLSVSFYSLFTDLLSCPFLSICLSFCFLLNDQFNLCLFLPICLSVCSSFIHFHLISICSFLSACLPACSVSHMLILPRFTRLFQSVSLSVTLFLVYSISTFFVSSTSHSPALSASLYKHVLFVCQSACLCFSFAQLHNF